MASVSVSIGVAVLTFGVGLLGLYLKRLVGLIGSRCKRRGIRCSYEALAEVAPWDRMRQQGGMKASTAWSPAAGLNVVSVQFAPQHLLTNASGSVRSRSASHCSSPPRALEVSQPEV
jgi:hypothetical protein